MKSKKTPAEDIDRDDRINRALGSMKHSDLQKACILRGLEFTKIVDWDHHKLSNWFYHNFELGENPLLLNEYDGWIEKELEKAGYKKGDAVFAPCFRFGFSPPINEIEDIKTPGVVVRMHVPVVEKEQGEKTAKRTVDESTGIVSGTKKNLTYQLSAQGLPLVDIVKKVMEQFPEAQEKSIKIWVKREQKARE